MQTYEDDFEKQWSAQPVEYWVKRAPQPLREEWEKNKKMNTAGDWIALVPIALVVVYMDRIPVAGELLRYGVAALLIIVWFVVWTLVRPYVTGKRAYADIEADVKAYFHQQYRQTGKM